MQSFGAAAVLATITTGETMKKILWILLATLCLGILLGLTSHKE
jgi:hypothetical protein